MGNQTVVVAFDSRGAPESQLFPRPDCDVLS